MKVRIGSLEILDVTISDLEHLVARYGSQPTTNGASHPAAVTSPPRSAEQHAGNATEPEVVNEPPRVKRPTGRDLPDQDILQMLVNSRDTGVLLSTLGDATGKRGKSTRAATKAVLGRAGLLDHEDPAIDPFENVRIGSKRGVRLKEKWFGAAWSRLNH